MPLPTRSGSIGSGRNTTASGSQSVTIPSNAQIFLFGVSGYNTTPGFLSGGTVTIGGQAFDGVVAADAANADMMGALFYKFNPPTGSGLTLAFTWTATPSADGVNYAWGSYTNVDTSGLRDSDGSQQPAAPHICKTLLSPSGDLIVSFGWQFVTADRSFAWTGATEVAAGTSDPDWGWAETAPSANQAVSFSVTGEDADGGLAVVVLKPGTAPSSLYASIDESSTNDADYIVSSNPPTNDTCRVKLSGISTPGPGTVSLFVRHLKP